MADHEQDPKQEEGYQLVYNMWITNMTINAKEVILQTGKPVGPPPPTGDDPVTGTGGD